MKKTYVYQLTLASCFFLAACHNHTMTDAGLTMIPLETAIDAPTELKVSDYFRQISYVPLETNDSCLVGKGPVVQIVKDRILVSTNQNQCLMFDKNTGKFIKQVGHVGNDPEGYSSVYCWGNNETGMIYFSGWNNDGIELVCYDQEGLFKGKIKLPLVSQGSGVRNINTSADGTWVCYKEDMFGAETPEIHFFKDNKEIASYPFGKKEEKPFDTSNINEISVLKNEKGMELFGPTAYEGVILITYKEPETGSVVMPADTRLWRQDKDLYLKEAYNDTIYQVKDTLLVPVSVIGLGKYHWDFSERFMKNKDNAVSITQLLDSEDRMIIRFIRQLFHQAVVYNAVFTKSTGEVSVGLYEDGLKDDLANFLPLQPMTVSPAGEYAGLLPAADVAEWFEENGNKDLPRQIKELKRIGEEDNPVVVIMK